MLLEETIRMINELPTERQIAIAGAIYTSTLMALEQHQKAEEADG